MSGPPGGHPVFGATTVGGAMVWKRCECVRELMNVLGNMDGDLRFLLPFLEGTLGAGADVQDISFRGLHASNVVAVDNVPVIRGDFLSYRQNGVDEYLAITDNVLLSAVAAGIDAPFSVGCAFKLAAIDANVKSLICKGDFTTPNAEWFLRLDATELLEFQVFDDSVGATGNMGVEDSTPVVPLVWYVAIGTYDGRGTATPNLGMNLYRWDGETHDWDGAVDDALIDGAGVYVDMEVGTGGDVRIGASNTGAAAAEFWPGEIMLPFLTMRELSAGDAERAAAIMVRIMGL